MTRPPVGLLFVSDVLGRYAWSDREGPEALAAFGYPAGVLLPPVLGSPDPVVLVVDRFEDLARLAWLEEVRTIVVRPRAEDAFEEELWQEVLDDFGATRTFVGRDSLLVALDAALELAPREALVPAARGPLPRLESGPWVSFTPPAAHQPMPTRLLRALRSTPDGVFLDGDEGAIDLATGAAVARRARVRPERSGRNHWRHGEQPAIEGPYGYWLHEDPFGRVGWSGMRCVFDWWLRRGEQLVPWVPSEHDWPLGHGKKLWGYENNDPVRIELAPNAERTLSHYGHDVLLTGGLPLRWRAYGPIAVAERFTQRFRALFYAADPELEGLGDPWNSDDEDGRHRAPVVALGPGATYAVDQQAASWRLTASGLTQLEGRGTVLYDESHNVRDRRGGSLLGGSCGRLVLQQGNGMVDWDGHGALAANRPLGGAVPVGNRANLVVWDANGGAVRLV